MNPLTHLQPDRAETLRAEAQRHRDARTARPSTTTRQTVLALLARLRLT